MSMLANRWAKIAAVAVAASLLVTLMVVLVTRGRENTGTAYFPQTVSLYPGDEVRVLGVEVGKITDIQPLNDQVKVDFEYDSNVEVPAAATAAIISPSLVGVRYVQLGPAYNGGPTLADGAVIPIQRTAAPAEWDEVKKQVDDLAAALAPHANQTAGTLTRLLNTTSANLDGQGPAIRDTLSNLSKAVTTLSDGRTDLFATIRNLQVFISAIRDADDQVARFQSQLAQVSGVLADNNQNLARALNTLSTQVPIIQKFLEDNRDRLSGTVGDLNHVVANLSTQRQSLADILQRGPAAVSNFGNMIDDRTGDVTAALAANNVNDPAAFVCDAAAAVAPGGANDPTAANACRTGLGPLLDLARLQNIPIGTNPITRDGSDEGRTGSALLPRPGGN